MFGGFKWWLCWLYISLYFCFNEKIYVDKNKYNKVSLVIKNGHYYLYLKNIKKKSLYIKHLSNNRRLKKKKPLYSNLGKHNLFNGQNNVNRKSKLNTFGNDESVDNNNEEDNGDKNQQEETNEANETNEAKETNETKKIVGEKLQPHETIVDHIIKQHEHLLYHSSTSRIMQIHKEMEQKKERKQTKKCEATIHDILYGGFLNIYKPANLYSMKVCEKIKRILKTYFKDLNLTNIKVKVGHGGTLDPFAEGVLIIGIQNGTKQLSTFLKCYKTYLALSIWGFETDTLDREGKIIKQKIYINNNNNNNNINIIDGKEVHKNIKKFIGWQEQIPPIFSAKRVKGKRLYEYARKNISVQIKPQKVHITNIKYLEQVPFPFSDFQITCSGGTYIRSLIRDIAHSLNNYATLVKLIRTHQQNFTYKDSLHYDSLNINTIQKYFIKL